MPNISKPVSAKPEGFGARLVISMCTLLLVGVAAAGISRAIATKAASTDYVVTIENMKFSPPMVSVHVGDRVIFKNADLVPHTATAKAPATFDSAALKNGDEWTFTAEQTGGIRYVCTFHPMMEGSIVVQSR